MDLLRTSTVHRRSCSSAQCETGHAGFVRDRQRAHRNIPNTKTRRSGLSRQGRLGALIDIASEADRDHPDGPLKLQTFGTGLLAKTPVRPNRRRRLRLRCTGREHPEVW